ncbi:hypothetical protein [Thiosocius teredinicola]|uniref:hypothetical protein n=1 Tax=Thiosocius teredinicola TaxID=1973002 RepID=UPI0009912A46
MRYFLMVLSAMLIVSCDQTDDRDAQVTKSVGSSQFENEYFDLKVSAPNDWYSQDPESTIAQTQKGANMMAGDDQNLKAVVDESLKSSIPLFAFYRYEPGTPGKLNANVIAVAERIDTMPGIKTGCDYLFHVRQLLEHSAVKVDILSDCETTTSGKATIGHFFTRMNFNGVDVNQRINSCVSKQYALTFTESYFGDEDKAAVRQIMDSLDVACQ